MPDTSLSSLFEFLPIGAYRSTPGGVQLRANAALVRLNGYASESDMLAATQALDQGWYVEPDRRATFKALMEAQGAVVNFVSEVYRHKTRERIWVREHAHQVCDAQGQVLYYEGTVQDITQEYQNQLALQASESRFRAMTELSSDWYWELDAQCRFTRLDVGSRSHSVGIGHESAGRQTLGGANFGVLLPWWDMLFGTANFEKRFDPTGVRDQVEQGRDYGRGFWNQQWLGLKRLAGKA